MNYSNLGNISDVPPAVLSFPSMMTLEEKALLFHLARDVFSGAGVIVDAGLFLGASTHAFCHGLRAGGRATQKVVHAYDIAIWSKAGFDKYLGNPAVLEKLGSRSYSDGESYQPLLEDLLSEHDDLVDLRIGDIVNEIRTDRPVEIAFFDLLKNGTRDWAVFKTLGPHYIAGKTIIVQQDYFYEDALENKIRQEYLSPYFEFLGAFGSSGVFKLIKELPSHMFEKDVLESLPTSEKFRLLKQAVNRIPVSKFQMYASLGVIRFLILNNQKAEARSELDQLDRVMMDSKHTSPRARQIADLIRVNLS